jgi:GT2 family glycosyltransferase
VHVCYEMGGTNGALDFSVVIPTRDRPGELLVALQALTQLEYPRDRWEALVVLDGGDEDQAEAVRRRHPELPLDVIAQAQAGPAEARNTGAERARGRFIAFTDDDCVPRSDWLAALGRRLREAPGALVGGLTVNGLPDNRYSQASQYVIDAVYRHYNEDPGCARFLTTNNLAVPAETYRELGGFDPSFPLAAAEDRDFCDRWHGAGHPLVYAPDAVVTHLHRMTFRKLARQQYNYGRGASHYRRARRRRGEPGEQVAPSFYASLLQGAFADGRGLERVTNAALVTSAQLIYASGYLREELSRLRS